MSTYEEEYTGPADLELQDVEPPPIEPPEEPSIEPRSATIVVKAGTRAPDIQAVLDRAAQGDVIKFEQGSYEGQFLISRPGLSLTGQGATFIHPSTGWEGCFRITAQATLLDGMTIKPKPGNHVYGLISVGWSETVDAAMQPRYVTLKNLKLRGDPQKGAQRAIMFEAGTDCRIQNCDIDDIFAGVDAQCIWSSNGIGGWVIENCKMRASGQAILIGGTKSNIQGYTIRNIVIKNNAFRGRMGAGMLSKYILEFKRGENISITDNYLSDFTGGVNAGSAIGLTVRLERNRNPWVVIKNIYIARNRFWNVGRMINALGRDDNSNFGGKFEGLTVYDNLAIMGGPAPNYGIQLLAGIENIEIGKNTIVNAGTTGQLASSIYVESPPTGLPVAGYVAKYPIKNMQVAGNVLGGPMVGRGCAGQNALNAYTRGSTVASNVFLAPHKMGGNQTANRALVLDKNYAVKNPYTAHGSDLYVGTGVGVLLESDGKQEPPEEGLMSGLSE